MRRFLDNNLINPPHKHSGLWALDGSPQAVWVDADGNVGIGIDVPAFPFHFSKTVDGESFVFFENPSTDPSATMVLVLGTGLSGIEIGVYSGVIGIYTEVPLGIEAPTINLQTLDVYDDNADALADGKVAGDLYRTGDFVRIVNEGTDNYISQGTYTPTLTNVANLDGSTAYQCQYIKVGNIVTVSGKVDIDPTLTATTTQLGISLPIASNIGAEENCCGTAFSKAIPGQGAAIIGDAANNRAQLELKSGDITNQSMYFTFTYTII